MARLFPRVVDAALKSLDQAGRQGICVSTGPERMGRPVLSTYLELKACVYTQVLP
jgi:hypothetical protein